MPKIVFFDIDGTLRGFEENGIRPSVRAAVAKARRAGVKCFVCTGRHPLEISEENLLDGLEFDGYIYLNGSYCVDAQGRALHRAPIDPSQLKRLLEMKRSEDFSLILMEEKRMYIDRSTPLVERMQSLIHTRVPPVVADLTPALERDIYQMILFASEDTLARLMAQLPFCEATRWFDAAPMALDVTPAGSSKCEGIRRVLAHYGISADEAAAVGDGLNDADMLRMVGMGVAMGNACAQAKAAARAVAPDVEQDGLAWAVDYILGEKA